MTRVSRTTLSPTALTRMALMVAALATVACASADASKDTSLPRMDVDYAFAAKHKCQGVSPEIRLRNVPPGTASYDVKMTDLDVPSFQHWSQTIPASGPVISEDGGRAVDGVRYYGPCPPRGTHRYQIEVVARDAKQKPLAYGEKMVMTGR
jgi:phosphatidylethanolamine-binding protein (PEBP) family uncharacterized protein